MKLFKFFKNQKGFTLIELLVVIGVLGILAAGLLATIDPLEQFRKGADSNRKTTSLELVNAFTRYYSVHGVMPWAAVADGGAGCNGEVVPAATAVSTPTGPNAFNDCLARLVSEGELKDTFPEQYNVLQHLRVTELTSGGNPSVAVCFDPESKSESSRPETQYDPSGDPSLAACDPATNATCTWCAQ